MSLTVDILWDDIKLRSRVLTAQKFFQDIPRVSVQTLGPVFRARARDLSPKRTGKFQSSWGYRTRSLGDGAELSLSNVDPKAEWILFGTQAHVITARGRAVMFGSESGDTLFRRRVNHPGTEPNDIFEKVSQDPYVQQRTREEFDRKMNQLEGKI